MVYRKCFLNTGTGTRRVLRESFLMLLWFSDVMGVGDVKDHRSKNK